MGAPFHDTLQRALAGDREAMGHLLQGNREEILRVIEGMLRSLPGVSAKIGHSDIAQTTMLRAVSALEQFEGDEAQFQAWLRRIAQHECIAAVRRFAGAEKRTLSREAPLSPEGGPPDGCIPAKDGTPSEAVMRQESIGAVRLALSRLDEEQQRLILLRNHEMLSFPEIGRLLGISEDAARMRWGRAIAGLRRALDAGLPGEDGHDSAAR